MSQYISFFIRKDDNFIPLFTFSARSSVFGELMEGYAPWEKIRALSREDITKIQSDIKNEIEQNRSQIERTKRRRESFQVMKCGNFDEICAAIEDAFSYEDHLNDEIKDYEYYSHLFSFLSEIQEEYKYPDALRADNLLYAGTEVGSNVSVKDIE